MKIALASPRVAGSLDDGLANVRHGIADAARHGARVVCFPEAYLPGLRGLDFEVPPFDEGDRRRAVALAGGWAKEHRIAVILGMEWPTPAGRYIAAAVLDADGVLKGVQAKNQLDPSEEAYYVAGAGRRLFEVDGLRFGVAICHEGFRYPETVRWAARQGAQVVFHPQCTGSDRSGPTLTRWGDPDAPYYEKAMMCRALENTIYVAGVNYAFRHQASATCVIDPSGACIAQLPYGEQGVLATEIVPAVATGLLASRFAPERYRPTGGTADTVAPIDTPTEEA